MSYTVKLGFTSGDKTYSVLKGRIESCVGTEGKHATQSTPVKVQSAECAALLLVETAPMIPATLYHDSTVIFQGYVRPYRSVGAKNATEDPVSLEIMDSTEYMHVVAGTDIVYNNKTIAELVALIYAASGATPTLGTVPAALSTYTLDRFRVAADEYWDEILSELLYEYGYDFVFTPGVCQIQKTTIDAAPNQSITDIRNNYKVERSDNVIDGTIVEYKKVAYRQNVSIYSDDTRFDTTKTGIFGTDKEGNYYNGLMHDNQGTPPAGNLVSWDLSGTGIEGLNASSVLAVDNVSFSYSIEDEDGITLTEHFEPDASDLLTGARWWLHYDGTFNRNFGIGWGWVIRAHGNITYLVDGNWQYKCDGDDPKKFSAKYISSEIAASDMAGREYKRFKVCHTKYTFDSLTSYNVGEFYNLEESTVGVDTIVRIISRSLSSDGVYSYQCEGADSINLSVTVRELQVRDIAAVANVLALEADKTSLFGPEDVAQLTAVGFSTTMTGIAYRWYINGLQIPGSASTIAIKGSQLATGYNTIKVEVLEDGVTLVSRELQLEFISTQKVAYGTALEGQGRVRGAAGSLGDYYINVNVGDLYKCIQSGNEHTAIWEFVKNTQGEPVTVDTFKYEVEYGLSSSPSEFVFSDGNYGYDGIHTYGYDSANEYGFKDVTWSPTLDGWYHGLYVWTRIKTTDSKGNVKYQDPVFSAELTQSLEDSCVIDLSAVPDAYTSNMRRTDYQYLKLRIADIGYKGTLDLVTDAGVFASYDDDTETWTDLTNALTLEFSGTTVLLSYGIKLPYAMDSNVAVFGAFSEWTLNDFDIPTLSICPSIEKNPVVQLATVNTYADLPEYVNVGSQDANISDNLIKGDYILVKFLTLTATSTTQATDETGKTWNFTELSSYYDEDLDPISISAFVSGNTYYAFAIYAWMHNGTSWERNATSSVEINTVKEAVDLAETQHDLDPTVDYHKCLYAHQILVQKLTAGVINVGNLFVENNIESTNYTEDSDGTPVTGYKLDPRGGDDGAGEIKSVGGVYANMNVRGILNLTKPDGSSAAEIIHPAITTVKGMPGDSTGRTADTPTKWKVKNLTDLITTQNNPVSVTGTYGSDSVTKVLYLTDFATLKENSEGTIATTAVSAGITLDKVVYGNGVYVGFYTGGTRVHPEGHVYTSSDGQNWTQRLSGTDTYAAYCAACFHDGYFYAHFSGSSTPGGAGFFKSSDGVTWTRVGSTGKTSAVYSMAIGNGYTLYHPLIGNTLYRGTDSFTDFQSVSTSISQYRYSDVDKLFYAISGSNIASSSDGVNWSIVGSLPSGHSGSTWYLSEAKGFLFVRESSYDSYYSTDQGQSWTKVVAGSYTYYQVVDTIAVGTVLVTNPQETSRWRMTLKYDVAGITSEDVGKKLYYCGTWKSLDPNELTNVTAEFTSGITFDSDDYINYRTLSNFINYTQYSYVDPDDGQTKVQNIELNTSYRVTSTDFGIDGTPLTASFFTRNSSTSVTIVCSNGQSYTFTSGNYYYVEGSIAIADSDAGVEMMGQYPELDNTYDIGTPKKKWLTGYISSLPLTSKRSEKKDIEAFERSGLDVLKDVEIVRFKFKKDKRNTPLIGFIADDTDADLSGENHDSMMVNNCIAVLIKAVQELSAEVERLKGGNA